MGKSPFFIGKSPFFIGKSPFLIPFSSQIGQVPVPIPSHRAFDKFSSPGLWSQLNIRAGVPLHRRTPGIMPVAW